MLAKHYQFRVAIKLATMSGIVALFLGSATGNANAQALIYLDAQDDFGANPNLSSGDPATYPNLTSISPGDGVLNDQSAISDDDKWGFRAFGSGGNIYEAGGAARPNPPGGVETARPLKQTISGLDPLTSYDVYVAYWSNNDDWAVGAGFTLANQTTFNRQGTAIFPNGVAGTYAGGGAWTVPPVDNPTTSDDIGNPKVPDPRVFDEGDRRMYLGKIGATQPNGSGQIEVIFTDPPLSTATTRRSFLDGLAYVPAGTEVFLKATVNRSTGEIVLDNETPLDFNIKSYSINSNFGSLDATHWDTITGNTSIDPDPWSITAPASPATTPFTTSVAEQENAGGSGGAILAANSGNFPFGNNLWISTPIEDVSISLTLADGSVVSPIVSYIGTTAVAGDLDGDGDVTLADYAMLSANMHTDVSSLTGAEAYLRGNLTMDVGANKRINYEDFEDFVAAFDTAHGAGSFAAATGVPEPTTVVLLLLGVSAGFAFRRVRPQSAQPIQVCTQASRYSASAIRRGLCSGVSLLAVILALASSKPAHAVAVTGWAIDTSFGGGQAGTPILTNQATNSPTLGDNTLDNARNTAIYASFPQVSLVDGQQVSLSGSANLIGSEPSIGAFRFGLLYEGGTPDTFGWLGFLNENSNGQVRANLNSKNPGGQAFATTTFASTVGDPARGIPIDNSRDREWQEFLAGNYDFTMTIGRFGSEVYVDSSLSNSASGFLQKNRYAIESDPARLTFNYNRVGLLAGDGLASDQVAFSNIDVSTSPIQTVKLRVTTSGPTAGTTKIVNTLGQNVNLNYYEISSTTGGLSLSGWDRLDADPANVGAGWNVAGGSSGLLLSESNLDGSPLNNNGELNLGHAFDPLAAQNLKFYYGLTDGTFVRGLVEYVADSSTIDGDYNHSGVVDAADYVLWRKDPAANGGPTGYDTWRANFGKTSGLASGQTAIPEPSALVLLVIGSLAGNGLRRRGS
jgi:hypothetical protein